MNELIEKLIKYYSNGTTMRIFDFEQAVQIACQAQRNACARVYKQLGILCEKSDIQSAEITEADYE